MILFFDTETTARDPHKARIVQLAAVLCADDLRHYGLLSVIIRPDGFTIPPETTAIHGISQDRAIQCGCNERTAILMFLNMLSRADLVVAHNFAYDRVVVNNTQENLVWPKSFCTMQATTNICKLPGPYGYKWPKLSEAYEHFFPGEHFEAHTALGDVKACMRVYKELMIYKQTERNVL